MKNVQLGFGSPADFCTVAWAAEKIGISMRGVTRLFASAGGPLAVVRPRVGSRESGRAHQMLYVAQVEEYATAYRLVRRPPVEVS